ncbi:MAG: hypothetical protein JKX78_14400 [Alteromonadaceae bacterium]|nr:hypothetical protein [Alteromonadaceae bacterium]
MKIDIGPNDLIKNCLDGLKNIKINDDFEEPKYLQGDKVLPREQPIDLVDSKELFYIAIKRLDDINNKRAYWWCCLVLNRLLRNLEDPEIGEYLIDKIKSENEPWKIINLTSPLSIAGGYTERVVELLYLLEHKNSDIRGNVVEILKFTNSPKIEDPLLNLIAKSNNAYEILFSLLSLYNVATEKSLEQLYKLLYHKKQEIKVLSLSTISRIRKKDGHQFYLNLLADKNYRNNDVVINIIREYSGSAGVSAVCDRVSKMLRRKRGRTSAWKEDGVEGTELVHNVVFLGKYYSQFSIIEKTYKNIEKKWDNVQNHESDAILKTIKVSRSF